MVSVSARIAAKWIKDEQLLSKHVGIERMETELCDFYWLRNCVCCRHRAHEWNQASDLRNHLHFEFSAAVGLVQRDNTRQSERWHPLQIGCLDALTRFQLEHHSTYYIALESDISGDKRYHLIFQCREGDLKTSPFIPYVLADTRQGHGQPDDETCRKPQPELGL